MIPGLDLKERNEVGLIKHELLLAGTIIIIEGYFSKAVKKFCGEILDEQTIKFSKTNAYRLRR